jgi:hypothetical protein
MQIRMVSGDDSAKHCTSAAKLLPLHGMVPDSAVFEGLHLMLEGMRIYMLSNVGSTWFSLVPWAGGYALFLRQRTGPRVWLIAERSKRVRIFRRVETALALCREQLEVHQVSVLLHAPSDLQQKVDSDAL